MNTNLVSGLKDKDGEALNLRIASVTKPVVCVGSVSHTRYSESERIYE